MYNAVVAKIKNITPIPNTDNIATGDILGNTVVVSRKTQEEQLGVYFAVDGQLSEAFAKANDLVRYKDPQTGETKGGFFDTNRRVRAQAFRGVRSEGFWCPVEYLAFTGCKLNELKEGETFDVLNGVAICNKYVTEATRNKIQSNKLNKKKTFKKLSKVLGMVEHFDTSAFRMRAKDYKSGDLITCTSKIHGTSQRFAFLLKKKESHLSSFIRTVASKFGFHYEAKFKAEWEHVVGTRRVVLDTPENPNSFYGNEQFRFKVTENLRGKLHKNEILFMEICGFQSEDKSIMPPADLKSLKDKTLIKKYGDKMFYRYGCKDGECKLFVYRIATTNEDGFLVDLTWHQMVERCKELGIETVPLLHPPFIFDGDTEKLRELVESLTEGDDPLDKTHLREGVCVRAERYPIPLITKNKSFQFKLAEQLVKEDPNYVDIEESA